MPKVLTRKILLALVGAIAFLFALWFVGLPTGMSYYESHTRDALLRTVAQELSPGASYKEMTGFLERHTTRYGFDDRDHLYGGYAPQTRLDKFVFDRKVRVDLKVNADKTFAGAEVRFFYTFL